jgi:hypothetical protein
MSRFHARVRSLAFIVLAAVSALALQAGQRWFH